MNRKTAAVLGGTGFTGALALAGLLLLNPGGVLDVRASSTAEGSMTASAGAAQPNVIFILTDDQRYDELGFMNPVIDTPNMDRIAEEGVHFRNAFVTTALCSPSRASILTGQYMHNHGVVDNNEPPRPGTVFFPRYLQQAGYETAFIGKWHMGEKSSTGGKLDDPQPGFDHWVSFAGQGDYYPIDRNGRKSLLNVNGTHVEQKGYITDELTDYALAWLRNRQSDKPFFMYLSHKAVHANFAPARRHFPTKEKNPTEPSGRLPVFFSGILERRESSWWCSKIKDATMARSRGS